MKATTSKQNITAEKPGNSYNNDRPKAKVDQKFGLSLAVVELF